MSDVLKVALKLYDRGFHIEPTKPGTKRPARPGWQSSRLSREELERWLRDHPGSGIGVVCGAASGNLVVVDFDGKDWAQAYDDFLHMFPNLAVAPRVRTASGRIHIWVWCPDLPLDATRLVFHVHGCDAKIELRANGHFAVAPTTHLGDGQYCWDVIAAEKVEMSCLELVDALARRYVATAGWGAEPDITSRFGGAKPAGDGDIPEGMRNDTLARMGIRLRRDGFGEEAIEAALMATNRQRCKPPLEPAEVLKIIRSVMRYEPKRSLTRARLALPAPQAGNAAAGKIERWSVRKLLTEEFPKPNWIVHGIIPAGLVILAGRPKTGKSWLVLQIAAAVGVGGMVLDQAVERAPVVYFALEDSLQRIRDRINAQRWPIDADVEFVFSAPDLATPAGLEELDKICAEAKLVVIDTLARAVAFDQRDYRVSVTTLGALQNLAVKHNVAIVCVDHHRKPSGMAADMVDDIIESTAKAGVADTVIGLYRRRGDRDAELRITGRDVEERALAAEWDPTTCCWQLLGDASDVARSRLQQQVLDALAELGGEATTTELAEHIETNKGSVSRALQALLREGKVVRGEQHGRRAPYRLP
jgi:DNA-binding transcriptional ArsR family regulator